MKYGMIHATQYYNSIRISGVINLTCDMKFLIKLLLTMGAVMLYASILSFVKINDWTAAFFLVLILSILNVVLKPLLIALTIPITVYTMGIFLLFINAIILAVADWLIVGVDIQGFWGTVAFSIILSLTSAVLDKLIDNRKEE